MPDRRHSEYLLRPNRWLPLGAIVLAVLAVLGFAPAAAADSVLGNQGEIYELEPARIGDHPALELKITSAGEPGELTVVPGTDDAAFEDWESLTFEKDGGSVYAVWRSRAEGGQSVLKIAGNRDGVWTEPLALSNDPAATKLAPQMLVTHERSRLGPEQWSERTILHVLWGEESAAGIEVFYAPVILGGSTGPAAPTVFRLNDRAQLKGWESDSELSPALLRAPRLLPGRDARTVVAAFADRESGRVVAMEIDLLAQELSRAADRAAAGLLAGGLAGLGADGSVQRGLAVASTRAAILDNQDLVREALQPLATSLGDLVLQAQVADENGLTSLAHKARAHLIIGGARLRDRGVQSATAAESQGFATARGADGSALDLRFAVTRSLPPPALGDGTVRLVSARDGGRLLVSWSTAAKVSYRISDGASWSDVRAIALAPEMPLAKALALLEELVQAR